MKKVIFVLLLLIPFAYAIPDVSVQAKQAQLEYVTSAFDAQMNSAIAFGTEKNIDVKDLSTIRTSFENNLAKALNSESMNDVNAAITNMRKNADEFRKITNVKFNDTRSELQQRVKNDADTHKEEVSARYNNATALRKEAIKAEFANRIVNLKTRIAEDESAGKSSSINKLLLDSFQNRTASIDDVTFSQKTMNTDIAGNVLESAKNAFHSISDFFVAKTKMITENP